MKKIILTALLLAAFSTSAFAGAVTINAKTTIGSLEFSPSNNVIVAVSSTQYGYLAGSNHLSGSRSFLTDYKESKVYWIDQTRTDFTTAYGNYAGPTETDGDCAPDLTGSTYKAM